MFRRSSIVYGLLLTACAAIIGWQVLEHIRVRAAARDALVKTALGMATTLGVVIRSQQRFGGIVSQSRLESAIKDLVKDGELKSVLLLNGAGAVVASAGEPVDSNFTGNLHAGEQWGQ